MNKTELVEKVAVSAGLTKNQADAAVSALVATITEALKADDKVTLKGFGTFEVRHRKARNGRNPKTGETISIAESQTPAFKASSALKNEVNK